MRHILIFACALAVGFFSCKKENKSRSKTELLTSGTWHVSAYTVDPAIDWDGDGTDETNIYAIMDQCIKDDQTTFSANGTGELNEGAEKCDAGDPQVVPLMWTFDDAETKLTVQGVEYLIESLTENTIVLKQIEVISAVTVTHTVTFSH
jgi:hypothetical protein